MLAEDCTTATPAHGSGATCHHGEACPISCGEPLTFACNCCVRSRSRSDARASLLSLCCCSFRLHLNRRRPVRSLLSRAAPAQYLRPIVRVSFRTCNDGALSGSAQTCKSAYALWPLLALMACLGLPASSPSVRWLCRGLRCRGPRERCGFDLHARRQLRSQVQCVLHGVGHRSVSPPLLPCCCSRLCEVCALHGCSAVHSTYALALALCSHRTCTDGVLSGAAQTCVCKQSRGRCCLRLLESVRSRMRCPVCAQTIR